jgi:hypothetical protein
LLLGGVGRIGRSAWSDGELESGEETNKNRFGQYYQLRLLLYHKSHKNASLTLFLALSGCYLKANLSLPLL